MSRTLVAAAATALALAAAGCGGSGEAETVVSAAPTDACAKNNLPVLTTGKLTFATSNDARAPWFEGPPGGGRGYEAAVAYAVARRLGFSRAEVVWKEVPRERIVASGRKPFDLALDRFVSTAPADAVDLTNSYYDVDQAVVVRGGTPIASVTSINGLRPYRLGAVVRSVARDVVVEQIGPSRTPSLFPDEASAVRALDRGRIDGLVIDLPPALLLTPHEKVLGRLPRPSGGGYLGMVLAKNSGLTGCVDSALNALTQNGTLARLQKQWLDTAEGAPVLH